MTLTPLYVNIPSFFFIKPLHVFTSSNGVNYTYAYSKLWMIENEP